MIGIFTVSPSTGDTAPTVIVPFAGGGPALEAVKLNLAAQGIVPRLFECAGDFDYHLVLRKIWSEGRAFCLVEHDVLPWPGALVQLAECSEPWCAFPYLVHGELRSYLGCVKFDPVRLGALPLPAELTSWRRLDLLLQRELLERGHREHRHGPAVSHLNFGHARTPAAATVHPRFWPVERL